MSSGRYSVSPRGRRRVLVPKSVACVMIWLSDDVWIEALGTTSAIPLDALPKWKPLAKWHVYRRGKSDAKEVCLSAPGAGLVYEAALELATIVVARGPHG